MSLLLLVSWVHRHSVLHHTDGVPNLQEATGTFEQFVSTLRKERRKADEQFVQETIKRFNELKVVIEQVQHAAQQILIKHSP